MQQTMMGQKVAAYLNIAQKSEHLWNSVIVFLGTLILLGTIQFYPIYLVFILAALCGLVAFKKPPIGLIAGVLLGFPAVIYQSSIFGWIYILIIVAVLFEAFDNWMIISVLEILILSPFAFGGLPIAGWITIAGMTIGTLLFGSKKSLMIALPSVVMIMLLSSVWLVQTAYMPIKIGLYEAKSELQFSKNALDVGAIGSEINNAIGKFFDFNNFTRIWESLGWISNNIILLVTQDSLIAQVVTWGIVLYVVGYLSGRIKSRPQLISSLALLVVIVAYYEIGVFYGGELRIEFVGGVVATIVLLGVLEHFGVHISRESEIGRKEKMKSYGKFGMSDVSLKGDEKSMADVGGYEDVKTELRDAIIMPLEKKEIAYTYGIKPPAGILLFGPPGTGKTMLMRALAKELKYNFIEVRCSQILSQWYGESEKNLAEVFANARKNAPTVLFFDEMDSIGKKRNSESLDEVGPRVLSTLLQEMDGATKGKGTVMVIGATNLPSELDPALMRPGRFDKIIYMHLPDPQARRAILEVHLNRLPVGDDVNIEKIVRKTERFSGADIKNIVVEAKRLAAKEATSKGRVVPISMAHFMQVLDHVKPSTGIAQIEGYEQFRLDFERRVGGEKKVEDDNEVVRWEDVAGLNQVKTALLEAIELPLLHEKEMKELKVKPSKGILLFGPPGTGKTLIVRAAANELKASFQILSAAEVMKHGYGQAVVVIKETFNRARENAPGIIFVDEIETFAPARGSGGNSEILGQFLTEMDGVKGQQGVVVIAATNKPSMMDPAIMRPGRFDKIFYIPPPERNDRAEMFRINLGQFADSVDIEVLANATPSFSGADIASVCQELKMGALRKKIAKKEFKATTDYIMSIIKGRKPSITLQTLDECKNFLAAYGERGSSKRDDNEDRHYR